MRPERAAGAAAGPFDFLDAIGDPVAVLDGERRFVHANAAMARFLGLLPEQIRGKTCHALTHGSAGPIADCPFSRLGNGGGRESIEMELPGKAAWVKVSVDPLRDSSGRFAGAIHIITDITDLKRAERQADEESGLLRSLLNNVPGIVYRGRRDWSLAFIGAEVKRLTGHSAREFMSGEVGWKSVVHPDDLEMIKGIFREAVAGRKDVLRVEYRIRHADGTTRWIADRRQLSYDEDGRFLSVDGLLLDVADRKEAEERLRATGEKLQALVETSPLPIMALDLDGVVTLWNPAAERVFGWTAAEAIGRFNPMVPGEAREEFRALRERVVRDGGFAGVEIRRRRKDGTPIDISLSTAPMRDGRGSIIGIMAVIADISERKRIEEALRESEDRYRRLVDNSPEMIFVMCDGRVVFMNDTGLRLLGASAPGEVVGTSIMTLVHPDSRELIRKRIEQVVGDGAATALAEQKYIRLDGTVLEVEAMGVPIRHQGRAAAQVFARDITKRKEAEEALLRSQEQLRQAQKMEAVGRLAGGVAHDFNNLLTAIRGYSDLLLMQVDERSPLRREVEEIRKAGDRAADLTQQLLAFSRKQILQPKTVDLNGVVANMDKMVRRLIGEDVDLVTVLRPGLWTVRVDPGQIEQVLMNLVVNARDAMPGGGKLTIETSNVDLSAEYASQHTSVRPGPHVMLAVTDTGTGMDEETKTRLFEPFFTTKEKGKGTGLGLSTVYGIVKQSAGSIWVYSELGMGTTFKIYFPRQDSAEADVREAGGQATAPRGRETILLVEDEEVVRSLAREVLSANGYVVLEAANGDEALRICTARRNFIDLMITDVVMPRMGGRELADQIPPHLAGMRVLFMSGYPDEAIGHHGILEPGTPFLQKPFTLAGLLRKVREVLDS